MDTKRIMKQTHDLLIINTLENIRNVKGLYSGTIVGVFGVLFCLGGWAVFTFAGIGHSALIATLGLYAYIAIIIHHVLEIERTKWPKIAHWLPGALIFSLILLMFVLFLLILDNALALSAFMRLSHARLGSLWTAFLSLPGLIVLTFPLFEWEALCKHTKVDEFVRRLMK